MSFRPVDLSPNSIVQLPQTSILESIKQNTTTLTNTDNAGNLNVNIQSGGGGGGVMKGNDGNDGSGTDRTIKTDSNGKLQVHDTLGDIRLNNIHTRLNDGTQKSMILGNDGNDGSGTNRTIKTDSNGKLQVDDAGMDAHLVNLNNKISKGQGVIAVDGELQQVLMYGRKPDGTLQPLETNGDRLLVDVLELAGSGAISTSTALSSVQICGINSSGDNRFKTLKCDSNGILDVNDSSSNTLLTQLNTNFNSGAFSIKNENNFVQVITNASLSQGGTPITSSSFTLNNGRSSFHDNSSGIVRDTFNINVYIDLGNSLINHGGILSNFSFSFQESHDNSKWFLVDGSNNNFNTSVKGQDVSAITHPIVESNGYSNARYLRIVINNLNESNTATINAYIHSRF